MPGMSDYYAPGLSTFIQIWVWIFATEIIGAQKNNRLKYCRKDNIRTSAYLLYALKLNVIRLTAAVSENNTLQ